MTNRRPPRPSPRLTRRRVAALGASSVVALGLAGCSSDFTPPRSPRLATVMEGGTLAYVRDGKKFSHGIAGGGLVDAVTGVPQAEEAARSYQGRMIGGLVSSTIGAACFLFVPIELAIAESSGSSSSRSSGEGLASGALLCGLAGLVTGSLLAASAAPLQFDAVNLYNDEIDRRVMAAAPPYLAYPRYPPYPPYAPSPGYPPPGFGMPPPGASSAPPARPPTAPASGLPPPPAPPPASSGPPTPWR